MADQPGRMPPWWGALGNLRFAVIGAYVSDCFVEVVGLPSWGEDSQAGSIRITPGGKALNQAVALARLGGQVAAVGAVGDDQFGRDILATLIREDVDTACMEARDGVASPVCICFVSSEGETSFVWHINDDVAVTPGTVHGASAAIETADTVLITFEMPAESVSEAIRISSRSGKRVIVQPAPPLPDRAAAAALPWAEVDIIVPNRAEAHALLGRGAGHRDMPPEELARVLAGELGLRNVVVTLAESGCVTYSAGRSRRYAAREAAAIDTSGASDAFTAGLAAGVTAGLPETDTIHAAQSAAAWAVCHRGGWESMPYAGESGRAKRH